MSRRPTIPGPIDDKAVGIALVNEKSCLFDGVDERISIGDVSELAFERTNAFSLSCWFKTTTTAICILMSKRLNTGTKRGYSFALFGTADKFNIDIDNDDGSNRIDVDFATGVGEFSDGNWHHVVMTYDGSSTAAGAKLYVDNILKTPTVLFDNLSATILTTAPFSIASRNLADSFWEGNLDETVVHNKDLSASEVSDLFNSGTPLNPLLLSTGVNVVGYWRMGDGDVFPTLKDSSKNTNDGTMQNMEAGDIVIDTPP